MKIKAGWYKVLKNDLPARLSWTCGDGCCSDTVDGEVWYQLGEVIWVDEGQVGWDTHETGSDYEGRRDEYYRPQEWLDYVAEGYLEPSAAPNED